MEILVFATPSGDVAAVLGRVPRTLDKFARDHAATFRPAARS